MLLCAREVSTMPNSTSDCDINWNAIVNSLRESVVVIDVDGCIRPGLVKEFEKTGITFTASKDG